MNRVVMGEMSWTETPELVKEKLNEVFPKLAEHYVADEPVLSYFSEIKPHYQLGFLIPLKCKETSENEGCVIYYPIKDVFVRKYSEVSAYPVMDYERIYNTKRGAMRIIELNGKAAVQFTKPFQKIN